MEYVQELENLKKEINKSGEKIENLSGMLKNFSDLNEIYDLIKDFQEDSAFSRIESKIDIIAQADSTDVLSYLVEELGNDINQKHEDLSQKIASLEKARTQVIQPGEAVTGSENPEGLQEIGQNIAQLHSDYKKVLANLDDMKELMAEFKSGGYSSESIEKFVEQIRDSLENIDRQEFTHLEQKIENIDNNFASVNEKLNLLTETLLNSGVEGLRGNTAFEEIHSLIDSEVSGNLSSLGENLSQISREMVKISDEIEQKDYDRELNEKVNYLTELVSELREGLDLQGKIRDEDSENEEKSPLSVSEIEYISKNIAKINSMFQQIQIRLSDESMEAMIKTKFSNLEENFERMEVILSEISTFDNIKDELNGINRHIQEIAGKVSDNSGIEKAINSLSSLSSSLETLKENLPEKTVYKEIKDGFAGLNARVLEVYENLYPLQNLQTVNESFEYTQDKLGTIIEKLNTVEIENLENLICETIEKTEQISNEVKSGNESGDAIKCEIKHLNLKADNLKDILDRLVKFSGNSSEKFESNFEELKNAMSYLNGEIVKIRKLSVNALNAEELAGFVSDTNNKLQDSKAEENNLSSLSQNFQTAQDKLNILTETIKDDLDIENRFNNLHFHIDNQVLGSISAVRDCLNEVIDRQNNAEERQSAAQFLKHELEEIVRDLKYNTKNNISDDILSPLLDELNKTKELINNDLKNTALNEIIEKVNRLDLKISELQETSRLNESVEFIKETLYQLEEKFNYTSEKISNFAKFTSQNTGIEVSSVNEQLLTVKEELSSKIDNSAEDISKFLLQFSSIAESLQKQDDKDILKEQIYSLSGFSRGVSEDISAFCNELQPLSEIQAKVESIHNQVSFISDNDKTKEINAKIDLLTEEIRSYGEGLASIRQNNTTQGYTEILSGIEEIKGTVNTISENNGLQKFDKIEEKISGEFGSLGENIQEVKNKIENLNQSLNNLRNAEKEDIENALESGLDEIKGISSRVSEDVSGLKAVMSDLFDAIGSLDKPDKREPGRQRLEEAVAHVESLINSVRPEFEELKSSSGGLSEKLEGLTSEVSGISGETREKLDKFFEISRSLESQINDNSANTGEILNSLKRLSELNENQFNTTNLALDEIKGEFSGLGEELSEFDRDLTDLNSKINKLIINSSENNNALKENLDNSLTVIKENIRQEFKNNTSTLVNKTQISELSEELSRIYKKVDGLNSLSIKGLNTSDTIRQAILQMAEWIDSAGKLLEENNENTRKNLENVDNVLKTVSDSGKNISEKINRVCNKFDDFEVRLESIEARLERLGDNGSGNSEIRKLILDVSEKIPSPNGKKNANDLVLNKVDKLETQMILFETKIQRILEFVEQEKV